MESDEDSMLIESFCVLEERANFTKDGAVVNLICVFVFDILQQSEEELAMNTFNLRVD